MKVSFKILAAIFLFLLFWGQTEFSAAQEFKYAWQQQYYGTLNGEKSLLFSHEMPASKLAFADIDGDGDQDIFVGQLNGELAYFENQGNRNSPEFVLITQQYKAIFEVRRGGKKVKIRNVIDVGRRSAPSLVDIDNDGDYDLFVGSEQGRIWYFENMGNNLIPLFKMVTPKFAGINLGRNSVPIFADVNLKRKYDLLVGTVEGIVWLFFNEGTRKKANFESLPPKKVVEFGLETHAAPGLFDWDGDNDLDLVVGQKNGTLSLFLNEGSIFSPNWVLKEQNFQLIDIGGESAPYFVDIDGDGVADMVVGSTNPTVSLYQNRMQNKKRILWNLTSNMFKFNKLNVTGNRVSITAGDLDNDGDLDLIVGEKDGNLNYYENQGNPKEANWVLKTEELIYITGVENSSPTLGDLDGDGDLDLLVGEKQGQISLIMNNGTPEVAKWELQEQAYFQIDVGSNSVPRLLDIDVDGDLDLLIGNFAGRIILYLNKGNKTEPRFMLESTRFASVKVSNNAVPAFFDWNKDKFPDLIIGGEEGRIQLLISPGKINEENEENVEWTTDEKALFPFNVYAFSHPLLEDFNGDGNPDLLLGNYAGDFLLYLNKGTEGVKEQEEISIDNSIDQSEGSLVVEEVEAPVELEIELPELAAEDEDDISEEIEWQEEETEAMVKIDPQFVRVQQPLIQNETIFKSVPTLGDLDQDGDLDLLVGSWKGSIYFYENQGSETEWNFRLVSDNFLNTTDLENSAPLLSDLDQDGDLDLIVGAKNGRIRIYINEGSSEKANFVMESDFLQNVWLSMNSKPSVIDLDADGFLDLLVGNFRGKLVFIRNDSSEFNIVLRDYQNIDVGIGSTPSFADLNNSGQAELMIGSDAGKIFFFTQEKETAAERWKEIKAYGGNITFPRGTSPVAFDLDKDGDLDLITGTEDGSVILYRNDAIVREEEPEQAMLLE